MLDTGLNPNTIRKYHDTLKVCLVQERPGHADVAITLRTYSRVTKRMDDKATDTLDRLFAVKKNKDSEAI